MYAFDGGISLITWDTHIFSCVCKSLVWLNCLRRPQSADESWLSWPFQRSQVHSVIAIGKNIATQVLCSIPEKTWRIGIINSEQLKTEDDMIWNVETGPPPSSSAARAARKPKGILCSSSCARFEESLDKSALLLNSDLAASGGWPCSRSVPTYMLMSSA